MFLFCSFRTTLENDECMVFKMQLNSLCGKLYKFTVSQVYKFRSTNLQLIRAKTDCIMILYPVTGGITEALFDN